MNGITLMASIAVGSALMGCAYGYTIRDNAAKANAAKAYKAAEAQRVKMQEQLNDVSAKYELERERAGQVSVERTQTIKEYYKTVPALDATCAVPPAMYGVLANAVRDANIAAASEPSSELPDDLRAALPGN